VDVNRALTSRPSSVPKPSDGPSDADADPESQGIGAARATGAGAAAPPKKPGAGGPDAGARAGTGRWRRRLGPVLAVVVLGAAYVALAAQSPWVRHQLAVSFTLQPEPYLELYFTQLPTSVTSRAGGERLAFGVDLATHDLGLRRITLMTTVRRPSGPALSVSQPLDLAENGLKTVDLQVPLPRGAGPWQLVVSVPGRPEYLHFAGTTPAGRGS
jgi:hypothetical protein